MKTYINLTNGLEVNPSPKNVMRLQSTHCEQKLWQKVLDSIPDDLLWELVHNRDVQIIDNSEKPRISRALWQGAALGYFALVRSLGILQYDSPFMIYPRGRRILNSFHDFYSWTDFLDLGRYRYYRKFYNPQEGIGNLYCVDKTFQIVYSIAGNTVNKGSL